MPSHKELACTDFPEGCLRSKGIYFPQSFSFSFSTHTLLSFTVSIVHWECKDYRPLQDGLDYRSSWYCLWTHMKTPRIKEQCFIYDNSSSATFSIMILNWQCAGPYTQLLMCNLLFEFVEWNCLLGRVKVEGEESTLHLQHRGSVSVPVSQEGVRDSLHSGLSWEFSKAFHFHYLILLLRTMVGYRHLRYYL